MIDQILDEFNVIMNVRDCLQLRTNIKKWAKLQILMVMVLHVKESQIFCVYRRNGVNYEIYIIWKWCIWKSWM